MKELLKEQETASEELEILKVKVQKQTQRLESVEERIKELKEQEDYGSFKFVHANMPDIIRDIAPKHKVPDGREIHLSLSSGSNSPEIVASVPWSNEECSDENPCNTGVCPRCTLQHFKSLLDRLLAGYYAK